MPQSRPGSATQARRFFLWSRIALVGVACLSTGWAIYLQQTITEKQRREAATAEQTSAPKSARPASEDAGDESGVGEIPYEEPRPSTSATAAKPLSPEAKQRQEVIGQWEDDYRGKRYLTLKNDGTAVMVVEPAGIGKTLFAPKLIFDAEWRIEEGKLHLWTKGGEPKGKVRMVLKLFGDRAEQQILELTENRLRLLDSDGKTEYEWRRIMAVAGASD